MPCKWACFAPIGRSDRQLMGARERRGPTTESIHPERWGGGVAKLANAGALEASDGVPSSGFESRRPHPNARMEKPILILGDRSPIGAPLTAWAERAATW